jgi:hypothetical protein
VPVQLSALIPGTEFEVVVETNCVVVCVVVSEVDICSITVSVN